jgi:hypothetical protein
MRQQVKVGMQKGGTLVGQLAFWGVINNKKAQHNPIFFHRRLLPWEQVLSSSLKGLNNGGMEDVGSLLNQEACYSCKGL